MLPIRVNSNNTHSVYLDIHHVALPDRGGSDHLVISAILGDGWYEGEVAVEIGSRVCVTFADQYLDEQRIAPFFERIERAELEQAILAAVSALMFSVGKPGARQKVLAYRHDDRILHFSGKTRRRTAPTKRTATCRSGAQAATA